MTLAKLLHPDAIRLLKLDPGFSQDELRGELITARLGEDPIFEAISYRYSDPDKNNPQVLHWGSQNLYIGDNLANALRQFRHVAEIRTIWVDQLSVKQDDKDEKFQQVQIFGDVFSKASKVLIWLGKSNSESDRAMTLFEEVVHRLRQIDEQASQDRTANVEVISGRRVDAEILRQFFEKDWFSRVWTLQEAALAKKAEVWCGDKMLPFNLFLDFFEKADKDDRGHWARTLAGINTGSGGDDPNNPGRSTFQAISTVSKLKIKHMSSARILNILRPMNCTEQIDRIWSVLRFLPDLVAALSPYRGTTDASHLYSALAKIALEDGKFDYLGAAGLTLHRRSYQSVKDNDAVARDGIGNSSMDIRPVLNLPSWVPDWTFTVRANNLWVLSNDCEQKRGRPLFTAGRSSEAQNVSIFNDNKFLRIQAKILVDRVGDLLAPFTIPLIPKKTEERPDLARFVNDQVRKLDDQMKKCFKMASRCTGKTSYSNIELACRITLVGSMVSDGVSSTGGGVLIRATDAQINFMFDNYQVTRRVLPRLVKNGGMQFWIRFLINLLINVFSIIMRRARTPTQQMATMFGLSAEDLTRFQRMSLAIPVCDGVSITPAYPAAAVPEMCKAKRFFITKSKRYMGIAPDITQRNDRICVIPGCCTPFIIRPVGQHWQLVGECYVHGIMDGEVMDDETIPLISVVFE